MISSFIKNKETIGMGSTSLLERFIFCSFASRFRIIERRFCVQVSFADFVLSCCSLLFFMKRGYDLISRSTIHKQFANTTLFSPSTVVSCGLPMIDSVLGLHQSVAIYLQIIEIKRFHNIYLLWSHYNRMR